MTAVLEQPVVDRRDTGRGRLAHAVPEGSNVALCGFVPKGRPTDGRARHCPECEEAARRKSWVGR